jgi:2-amino-4-hydroxy-6-hydroxymethyldihydropteridine diphosphokinase
MTLRAAIGVGSNLPSSWGGRRATIDHAIDSVEEIEGITLLARSTLVETDPVGGPDQGPFLNGALLVEVADLVEPEWLLAELHRIERAHGRRRPDPVRWGPRTLDLDLLLMEGVIRTDVSPLLPHPRMHERSFVLEPLSEIAPTLRHPILDRSMDDLRRTLVNS